MNKLFGTNGVRGIFGEDLTLEFVHDLTLSLAAYFKDGPIVIGYDGRNSSPLIVKIVCAALNYSGLDCNITGLVPTPCLEYATKSLGYNGGIMITASHNPPQYNGIKAIASDGVEVSREDEKIIEEIYFEKNWLKTTNWGKTSQEARAIQTYINAVKSQIDSEKIRSRNFKVVLDLGNGAQAVAAPIFCKELNCEITTINEKIDGTFPGRGSEPTPQNLQILTETVKNFGADMGIAFDGDGDRSIICDNDGQILTGDKSALLLVKNILKKNPGSTVVTCLNSGSGIEVIANETKSKVIRTKVGSVEVSRKMVPINALIGFEENGGFMYGRHNQVRDGVMTLALILDLLATTEKPISKKILELPPSFTTKDKIKCSAEEAQKLIGQLKEENPQSDLTDGIKIPINSKNWVMIRPSGTEPIIRIYAEAESNEKLDELMTNHIQKIKSILSR